MVVGIASSLARISSTTGLWQVFNSMQMFLLIALLGVYLPKKILNALKGSTIFNLCLNINFLTNKHGFKEITEYFDFKPQEESIDIVGLINGSTLLNISSQLFILLALCTCHLFCTPLIYCDPSKSTSKPCRILLSLFKKIA
jgi:hypothetical protein